MNAKKWIRQNEFQGMPKVSDFRLVKEDMHVALKDRGKVAPIYNCTVIPEFLT